MPAAGSDALNRYQNIRSASFHGWDSLGRGMYITTRFADVPRSTGRSDLAERTDTTDVWI